MSFKWYPFNPIDFRKDTYHLSAAAEGIYRRLIDEYMLTRGSLPDSDASLAGIARVDQYEWETHKAVIRPFFKSQNGRLFHKRCEMELNAQAMRFALRSQAGKIAARARWERPSANNNFDADRMLNVYEPDARGMRNHATLHKQVSKKEETDELTVSSTLAKTIKEKGWA